MNSIVQAARGAIQEGITIEQWHCRKDSAARYRYRPFFLGWVALLGSQWRRYMAGGLCDNFLCVETPGNLGYTLKCRYP